MKNESGQKEARRNCLSQHACPFPSLCAEKLISWQLVFLSDLWRPSQRPLSCGMLLSPPSSSANGRGKSGMMWLDLLKIQTQEGLSHSSCREPSLEKAVEEQEQQQSQLVTECLATRTNLF